MIESGTKLLDWLYRFMSKPLAGWVAFIALITAGLFYGIPYSDKRYNKGFEDAEKKDSINIAGKSQQIEYLQTEKKKLELKIDSTDCADQMQKAIDLVNHFKSEIAKSNQKKIKALEKQNDFNKELEKYANNLENNAQ